MILLCWLLLLEIKVRVIEVYVTLPSATLPYPIATLSTKNVSTHLASVKLRNVFNHSLTLHIIIPVYAFPSLPFRILLATLTGLDYTNCCSIGISRNKE